MEVGDEVGNNGNAYANYTENHPEGEAFQHMDPASVEQTGEGDVNVTEQYEGGKGNEDARKIFVGGLSTTNTTDESLLGYFSAFGKVVSATVKTDLTTGRSRGFGFVLFENKATVASVLNHPDQHHIDGKQVDPKRVSVEQTGDGGVTAAEQSEGDEGNEDARKIFVGGLSTSTTNESLREYFSAFGKVVSATVKTDLTTGRSRGFGFVLFENKATVASVLNHSEHHLDAKRVDPKPAQSKDESRTTKEPVLKVFVGGVPAESTKEELEEYFNQFGKVTNVELPMVKGTTERRGFIFVSFETEAMADKCCDTNKQTIGGKECDVKKATPKQEHARQGGRGGFGGGMGMRGRGAARGGFRGGYGGDGGYGGGYDPYGGASYGATGSYGAGSYGGGYDQYSGGYGAAGGYDYSQGSYSGGGGAYGGGGAAGYGANQYWQGGDYGKMKARRGGGAGYAPY